MHKLFITLFFTLLNSTLCFAETFETIQKYSSVAHNKKGTVSYQEQHEVKFKDRRVQTATTRYLDSKGQVIGEMNSDFLKSITVPAYEYKDFRTGTSHGIKVDGEKITLWRKNREAKTESLEFYQNKFSPDTLLVGCQGLHYYLVENLDLVKEKKSIPIAYFLPGKLDYYSFTLKLDHEDQEFIYLTLSIDSFILKLFTSKLELKYSKKDRRLIEFSGLSNITDDNDQMQNVDIHYKYN